MSGIKFITEQDETGLGRIVVDGRYFGLPAREVAIFAAANERIEYLEGYAEACKHDCSVLIVALAAERAISDKMEKALTKIANTSQDEGGCYYNNKFSIGRAHAALAEVAASRALPITTNKGERDEF